VLDWRVPEWGELEIRPPVLGLVSSLAEGMSNVLTKTRS
jgi:hypothetical protein